MMMHRAVFSFLFVALFFVFSSCTGDRAETDQAPTSGMELPVSEHPDTENWDRLFRPDLSDAVLDTSNSWSMDGGVLVANDHSTIWSDTSYSNFVLDFEARTPDGTNSGVFIRTEHPADILSALELQMYNPPGPDDEGDSSLQYGGKNGMGAMYDLKAPSGGTPKSPDGWNRFTITARDSVIYVVMNGEQIHKMNLNDWTEPGMTPDGEKHKFDRAIKNQAATGPIGFQGIHSENGVSVEYRNIRIRRLGS